MLIALPPSVRSLERRLDADRAHDRLVALAGGEVVEVGEAARVVDDRDGGVSHSPEAKASVDQQRGYTRARLTARPFATRTDLL